MLMYKHILFFLPALMCLSEAANILAILPLPSTSHFIVTSALLKELAKKGHQVTVYSPFPEKAPIPNYVNVETRVTIQDMLDETKTSNVFQLSELSYTEQIIFLWKLGNAMCEKVLQEEAMHNLLHSKDRHFDLVIIEGFNMDCLSGFSHKFKAPLIQIVTFDGTAWIGDWVGTPSPYSYVPDIFSEYGDRMSFCERFFNTLGITYQKWSKEFYFIPAQQAILEKYFGHLESLPTLTELMSSTSLMLLNGHFSIGYPRPLLPNVVQVGGLHIKPPNKLSQDLHNFITEAPEGVIYFSMGSSFKSIEMPQNMRNVLIKVFGSLKQRVLWKWENDTLPGQPDNVKIGKWLPQSDILAYPQVRLFITHGGLLSTQETIHRAVPVIGIPVAADQNLNMARTESAGLGIKLDIKNITEESVSWAIKEILDNKRYHEKAEYVSKIYRDQPLSPLDQAVFWTEYVIRHKGAPHMRCAALDLNWFQYFLLDVIAVLLIVAVSIVAVLVVLLKLAFKKFCGQKSRDNLRKKRD